MEAGEPHGLTPLGLDALDMLRIEAGLIFAGYEFDDQVDPFEAGIGFTVTADKEDDFVGREALARAARASAAARSSGSSSRATRPPATATASTSAAHQVGVVTSGTRSPVLKKNIALCRMAVQYAELGHRGRGRQARRPPEADPRHRRAASRSTTPRRLRPRS